MLTKIAEKLGEHQSHTKTGWRYFANNQGTTVTVSYQVQYTNGQATEVFTLQGSGERMLILGHNINSPAFLGGKN